jgi:hypothetical protein
MLFVYPGILYGLFALALPVVIHLFNFRKHRTVYFSNIELLRNIQQQTNKTNKLKHLVVLLLRLLLIASLVIAFAQPYLPDNDQYYPNESQLVSIYIDNSKSMQAQGKDVSLFDEARQGARQIIKQSAKETRFLIAENNFQPKYNFTVNHQEAEIEIDAMQSTAPPVDFSQIIRHNKNLKAAREYKHRVMYCFSDFQKTMIYPTDIEKDTGLNLILVQSEPVVNNNIYIDSCWFLSPVIQAGFVVDLMVRIKNAGTIAVNSLPVQLMIEGNQKSVSNVDIEAGESVDAKLQLMVNEAGIYRGLITIHDFPIVFDDDLFFSFSIAQHINVLEIDQTDQNIWLKTLFEKDKLFRYESRNIRQLDYQAIKDYDLIIFNELPAIPSSLNLSIQEYLKKGGKLVVFPSQLSNVEANNNYTEFGFQYETIADTAKTSVYKLNDTHFLFKDVFVKLPDNADFPMVNKHFPMHLPSGSSAFTLMEMLNGNPFMVGNQYGSGQVFAFSAPLRENWSNLYQNNLFVPVMYKLSFLNSSNSGLYTVTGQSDRYTIRNSSPDDQPFRITSFENDFEVIPENRFVSGRTDLLFHGMIAAAGFYDIRAGDTVIGTFAVNENRKESALDYYNSDELIKLLPKENFKSIRVINNTPPEMHNLVKNSEMGSQLWKYFIILALILIFAEGLVLRFWK